MKAQLSVLYALLVFQPGVSLVARANATDAALIYIGETTDGGTVFVDPRSFKRLGVASSFITTEIYETPRAVEVGGHERTRWVGRQLTEVAVFCGKPFGARRDWRASAFSSAVVLSYTDVDQHGNVMAKLDLGREKKLQKITAIKDPSNTPALATGVPSDIDFNYITAGSMFETYYKIACDRRTRGKLGLDQPIRTRQPSVSSSLPYNCSGSAQYYQDQHKQSG